MPRNNWRARLAALDYAAIAHPRQARGITRVPTEPQPQPKVDPIALPCECDALPDHPANLLMDAYR